MSEGRGGGQQRCPACGEGRSRGTLGAGARSYRICDRCGSGWIREPIDVEEHYGGDYFPAGVRNDSPVLARRYETVLRRLEHLAPGRRLLEVGCGNGQLLAVARGRGWSVAGTELSPAQAEHCRRRGFDVVRGDLAREALLDGRSFDAAVLIEVYEHLPLPVEMLAATAARLGPGGILYLTTPNFASVSLRLLGARWSVLDPEHLTLATPRGLRASLERAGFEALSVRSRNVNPAELLGAAKTSPRVAAGPGARARAAIPPGARVRAAVRIRDRMDRSATLRACKAIANGFLALTGWGDTLVAWARTEAE